MTRYRINEWVCCAAVLCIVLGTGYAQAEPKKAKKEGAQMTVSAGQEISLEYTLRLEDTQVVDSNVGGDPFNYTQGTQQIIPGLESAVEGMAIGESKLVTLAPADG